MRVSVCVCVCTLERGRSGGQETVAIMMVIQLHVPKSRTSLIDVGKQFMVALQEVQRPWIAAGVIYS